MENRSQKRLNLSSETGSAPSVDRISNLPDSVIFHILSFLPTTKDAVGTSTLSRRWKFLWTGVPNLLFDYDHFKHDHDYEGQEKMRKFEQFVSKVLLQCAVQNVLKFWLLCRIERIPPPDIKTWICIAIARNVRFLRVHVLYDHIANYCVELPSCLFACKTLEDHELCHNLDISTPSLVCLPRLRRLKLKEVGHRNDESVCKLISGCPILEFLDVNIEDFDNMMVSVISSPSLKELCFHAGDDFPRNLHYQVNLNTPMLESLDYSNQAGQHFEISFQNITSLVGAKIHVEAHPWFDPPESDFYNSVVELVQALHRVKILTLSQETMKALTYATSRLSTRRFERLTKLVVRAGCCEWSCLQDLLELADNLEVLEFIKAGNLDLLGSEKISFELLDGLEDELGMIAYILEYGRVLNRLLLSSAIRDRSKEFQLKEKIGLFRRASPACEVAFRQDSSISLSLENIRHSMLEDEE